MAMDSQFSIRREWLAMLLLGGLALTAVAQNAQAQSTDRDNPMPLTANEVRGSGINKKVEYYYTFLAGPGELILTADARAKIYSTMVEVELFNLDAERLEIIRFAPDTTSERMIKRLQIAQQQPILLRIVLDSKAGDYLVRVAGAVQLENAATLSPA